jgi:hypothetical protein
VDARAASAVDSAIDTASRSQSGIGSIDDRVHLLIGNVTLDQFQDAIVHGRLHDVTL